MEALGRWRDGMHQKTPDADNFGRLEDTQDGIPLPERAKALPLTALRDRESPQNRDLNRTGHIAADTAKRFAEGDRVGSQA